MTAHHLFRANFEHALKERLFICENLSDRDLRTSVAGTVTLPLRRINRNEQDTAKATPDRDTDLQVDLQTFDIARTRRHLIETGQGRFWISGNAILCQCPDCQAPMTIRSWLRLADCWRCGASMQLSREMIDAIEQRSRQKLIEPKQAPPQTVIVSDLHQARPVALDRPLIATDPAPNGFLEEFNRLTRQSLATSILRRGFSAIPAWLISFLLHLILILLLALFVFSTTSQPPTITLSSFVNPENRLGGEVRIENPQHLLVDDLIMASDLEIDVEEARDLIQKAQQDAQELTIDDSPVSTLPELDEVRKNVTTTRDSLMSFAARDPRVRAEIVEEEGGTSLTEAAVARGLRWLASVQNWDGSWSLSNYDRSDRPGNLGDAAGTSLALLPFLGAGQTHEFGIYRETIAKGLAWLIKHQAENGDLRIRFPGQAGMYAHGQATIVLCEALAMTGDQKLLVPAQKAIRFIEQAQHRAGGWRYRPGESGDTSMLGWHLMALQSARAGDLGIEVDDNTLKLADYYLDQATYRKQNRTGNFRNLPTGSLYTYRPGEGQPTASMTAEAMLCRMYLGWTKGDPRMIEAVRWLIEFNLPTEHEKNIYYWYYGTQVMHHFGGDVWKLWNRQMREILVAGQEKSGSHAGSWSPDEHEWGKQGGRIYVTSLSVCTLEIYYRHLPIFKQIDLSERSPISALRQSR